MPSAKSKTVIAILALPALLAGCADYMNNRDSITLGAGNAQETNLAIHAVNPFPPSANNTHISSDGKMIYRTIQKGQKGTLILPVTSGDTGTTSASQ